MDISFEIICIEDVCTWKLSKIRNLSVSQVALLSVAIPEMILPVIVLIIMSILVTKSYHERMCIKSKLVGKKQKKENRITGVILLLTWLIIFTRIFDAINGLYLRLNFWNNISFVPVIIIRFLRQFSFLLQFSLHSFNAFIYVYIDKNLFRSLTITKNKIRKKISSFCKY